jgi:hypothetical protein
MRLIGGKEFRARDVERLGDATQNVQRQVGFAVLDPPNLPAVEIDACAEILLVHAALLAELAHAASETAAVGNSNWRDGGTTPARRSGCAHGNDRARRATYMSRTCR